MISNNEIKHIKSLNFKKFRDLYNEFVIEGEKAFEEAVKAKVKIKKIYETEKNNYLLDSTIISNDEMKKISNLKTPSKRLIICEKLEEKTLGNKVLILENIQDPLNLGTIIRSVVAFGAQDIFLSDDSVDIYNDKVLRGTSGNIFKINVKRGNLEEFLKKSNYNIYITDVDKGSWPPKLESPWAIVFGNEGKGVSEMVKNHSKKAFKIPTTEVESLNLSTAVSIFLYEIGGLK